MKRSSNIITTLVILLAAIISTEAREELVNKRSYHSKTFQNDNGTRTIEISLGFIHYKDTSDQFLEINPNFVPSTLTEYDYEVRAGLYHTYMKSDLSDSQSVIFETKDSLKLSATMWGVAYLDISSKEYKILQRTRPTNAIVSENEVLFQNAFNDVDIKYFYTDTRLKEEIYVSQAARNRLPDPNNYGFQLTNTYLVFITKIYFDTTSIHYYADNQDISNIDYETEDMVSFKDFKKSLKFSFPLDIAFLESERDSLYQADVKKIKRRLIKRNGNRYLLSGVPLSWLHDLPDGTVVFDPQIEIQHDGSRTKDANVCISYKPGEEYMATTNYGTATYLSPTAGTRSGYNFFRRSYLQFDLSDVPSTATIDTAKLNLYQAVALHSGGVSSRYLQSSTYIQRVTETWDESIISWYYQPSTTTTNQVSISAPQTATQDFTDIDVTDLVQDMVNSDVGNNGFLWILQNELKYRNCYAASSDYTSVPGDRPKLVVTYTPMEEYFYLKDHLGNIRVTIDSEGDVVGYDDYYPFGLQMPQRSNNTSNPEHLYKFGSKELDNEGELDWYYFGKRYYDPEIGRWLSVDPLASKFPSLSPYNYVFNDPVNSIDPDGREGFYFGFGTGGGASLKAEGLDKPSYISGSAVVYHGTESDGSNITGSAVTSSVGGIVGGAVTRPGPIFGYWFGDFADMENPTNSVGFNFLGVSVEIIVSGDKSDLGLSDILGIEVSKDGQGLGIGAYATENNTKIISQTNSDGNNSNENNNKQVTDENQDEQSTQKKREENR